MRLFSHWERGGVMRVVASTLGFAAVALGAFGAHALKPTLTALATMEIWQTASFYHLIHAVLLVCIALARPTARFCFWFFVVGILLFSGSLYLFALTGIKVIAVAAPVGGFFLLSGWIFLALHRGGEAGART